MWALDSFFAGIWAQVWHWGMNIGLLLLLGAAWFFLRDNRLLWAAAIIAAFLGGQAVGSHDQARKEAARKVVIEKQVDTVVEKTKTKKSRGKKDRWDRPEY